MKRLITILVVSVLSVISTNSSAVANDYIGDACGACKWKVQYIQAHDGEFSCSSLQTNDIVQGQCALQIYGSDNCAQTSSWVVCNQVLDNNRDEAWCDDQDVCGGTGGGSGGGGSATVCPSDCKTPSVTYQELGADLVKVSTRYCDASTNYVCRTKTENITPLTEKQFDTATADCVTGSCMEWGCVWTEGVGTTCGGDGNQPFCMCALYNGNYLKTVAVRLGCNSTTNTGYNCNGINSADDMDGSPLYCDLSYGTNAGTGICRYKKTCSTDCTSTNTNAWNVASNSNYLYRLKKKCDYTTGSCVSNGGTVVGDFDYKCNHDNRAYETAPTATCKKMLGGKPTTCSGCATCSSSVQWENASNSVYQQQYHYNFSPMSGTDRYQCVKTMNGQYRCNAGYYGNPGSSMTGCNACPTLASSGLTIVSKNEACPNSLVGTGSVNEEGVWSPVTGATTITQCYAKTGDPNEGNGYCTATLNDGSGTFYWFDNYINNEAGCFYK